MKLRILLITFSFIGVLIPATASAAVIAQQTTFSSSMDGVTVNNLMLQCVVVTSTATLKTVTVYADGRGAAPNVDISVTAYSNNNCTGSVIGTEDGNTYNAVGTNDLISDNSFALPLSGSQSIQIRLDRSGGGFANPLGSYGNGTVYYYILEDTITDSTTHIETVTPSDQAVVATSTSFALETDVYINPADLNPDMQVRINITNDAARVTQLASALVAWDSAFGTGSDQQKIDRTFIFPVNTDGTINFATTTNLQQIGRYTMRTTIENQQGFFESLIFSQRIYAASTTKFTVATSTAYDHLIQGNIEEFNELLNQETLECDTIVTTFKACVFTLLVPNDDDFSAVGDQLYQTFFGRVPFGYATRFATIMASSTPISPPGLSYTFGSSSPQVLQGLTYSINPFDYMDTVADIRSDDGENKNIWEIVDPYFTMVVAFAVLFVIIEDLLGMRFVKENSDENGIPLRGTLSKKQAYEAKVAARRNDPLRTR